MALLIRRPNKRVTGSTGNPHGSHSKTLMLYEQWVRQYGAELYRFAYRLCGNAEIAEDLLQEAFYEAWKDMGSLRDHERARAWLFQILRHRYARWCRAEAGEPAHMPIDSASPEALPQTAALSPTVDEDALQIALGRISTVLRLPLLMVFMEGLSCQETADRLDLPLGTVLSRIHRAKRQLRESLQSTHAGSNVNPEKAEAPQYRIGGAP